LHNTFAGNMTYHNALSEEQIAVFCVNHAIIYIHMRHTKSAICTSVCV
jgi:hypothetical protein